MSAAAAHGGEELQPQSKLTATNPLSRRLARILHLPLDDIETQEALVALSAFYGENTPSARRNLQSDIERRIIDVNSRFISAFDVVQEKLAAVQGRIDDIDDQCQAMDDQLRAAFADTSAVLKHTQDLRAKSSLCLQRKRIIEAFLHRFTLSEAQVRSLTTSSETVDAMFFAALKHAQQIQEDCKALLTTENQQIGLEIMEKTTMYQDAAFERLFRWVQAECRLMKSEAPEITVELKDGVGALKLRPILFQQCMQDVSNIRRNAIVRGFHDALTVGGPGGFPRPIEFHAHDTLRYTGDILAWIHQACVSEREMLEGLFDLQTHAFKRRSQRAAIQLRDSEVARQQQQQSQPPTATSPLDDIEGWRVDEELLLQVLDANLEGLCHPLKHRIEAALESGLGPITSYRITNLVQFYCRTVEGIIGTFSHLSVVLKKMTEISFKSFFEALNAQAADMLRLVQSPEQDLQPPQAVKDTISQLREIMLSYDGSFLSPEEREKEFSNIITALMDPVLQMCVLGSGHLKSLESAIYMVNCLHQIQTALAAFTFAHAQVQSLDAQIEVQIQVLVDEQYSAILNQSGLATLVRQMTINNPPLALVRTTDSHAVAEAMSRLDVFLVTVTVDVAETLSRISSVQIARLVAQQGFRRFVDTYRDVVAKIHDPVNKYEFPSTLVTRTVEDVETLLSLQDV